MTIVNPAQFNKMEWRCIGPHRGGRVVAVAGDPEDPMVFYFGACAGGLWKTNDGGTYWRNVSDGFFRTSSVGAVAVAASDPNVIYAGMGEACIRGNVCHGDGVYRSNDGGDSWIHLGLDDTRHIARVRVHPEDPDTVFVAAFGNAFGPSVDRGVFRSTDGGKNWEKVLFKSVNAGAIDLSMDPQNPRTLYAAIYHAQRYPWTFVSGGTDSGLYKSTDGGDTWADITEHKGMPSGLKGRIGVAVCPSKEGRVWAIVEAAEGGLYRSDDGGDQWNRFSDSPDIRGRPWYYSHVFADTQDPETVYILEGKGLKSVDGGRSFTNLQVPHGDNHDLWIDPSNPRRMINGNDGGACVSFNGGMTWSSIYNQPTAQFYHVTTDMRFPYRVYGSQQDNTSISLPSRSYEGAITQGDWHVVGGGESGHIAVCPDDSNIVYAGNHSNGYVSRYNHSTGQVHNVMVWPESSSAWGAKDMKYRFQWTFPILFSPHDSKVLYVAGNHVFRTANGGFNWECISPDLTRNDHAKLGPSGGPISLDGTNAEYYCTIFAFAESPLDPGVLWAGSDDGWVHISRDDGRTWENITPHDMPEWALISAIEPSPHDPSTAYIAATRYKLDDLRPYLYKTNDYGKSWKKIINGIEESDFTRIIREDPTRRGLLYAGTEYGVYISFDDGGYWQSLNLNLPIVPIHDLVVKENDLIAATHGRSFWIMDDITPFHQINEQAKDSVAHLYKPRTVYRHTPPERFAPTASRTGWGYEKTGALVVAYEQHHNADGKPVLSYLDGGSNPPEGLVVTYDLKQKPQNEITLTFFDSDGNEIIRFVSGITNNGDKKTRDIRTLVSAEEGMNRFVWNMRHPRAIGLPGDPLTEQLYDPTTTGPQVPPGNYEVQLDVAGETFSQSFDIEMDPRLTATHEDLEHQFTFLMQLRDKLSEANTAVIRIRNIKHQLDGWVTRSSMVPDRTNVVDKSVLIMDKLNTIEQELVQVDARHQIDRLKYPARLNGKLAALISWTSSADERPTQQSYDVFSYLSQLVDIQINKLEDVIRVDIPQYDSLIAEMNIPAITIPHP